MGDISPRFNRHEFACKDGCGFNTVDIELVNNLESLADIFLAKEQDNTDWDLNATSVSIHINSANRCKAYDWSLKVKQSQKSGKKFEHNKKPSEHLRSAADFWMEYIYPDGSKKKIDDDDIADELEMIYVARHGIGRYKDRTHYDIRQNGPARWDLR